MGVRDWWRNLQDNLRTRRELGRQAAERIAAGEQGPITVRSSTTTSTRTFTLPADGDLSALSPEVRAAVEAAREQGGHATVRFEATDDGSLRQIPPEDPDPRP